MNVWVKRWSDNGAIVGVYPEAPDNERGFDVDEFEVEGSEDKVLVDYFDAVRNLTVTPPYVGEQVFEKPHCRWDDCEWDGGTKPHGGTCPLREVTP